ncbi:MAG: hypothetical protein K6G10_01465 [Butyrivibrio sp.]|nr:hypothetical protein [Butyrivibrio sp.]
MLKPKGYDFEIDCCLAEVAEDPEYRELRGIDQEDVTVMTWTDGSSEDRTSVEVIKRSDILNINLQGAGNCVLFYALQ